MLIGCPKEIKNQEYRVGITPQAALEAIANGHKVIIQKGSGVGAGFADADYITAGATIVDSAEEIFATAEMVVKVKEPQPVERAQLREGQVLFTYLHLAPDPDQTRDLLKSGVTAIAYETVTSPAATLPLLAPMSEVAGRMSIQVGRRPHPVKVNPIVNPAPAAAPAFTKSRRVTGITVVAMGQLSWPAAVWIAARIRG